MTNISNSEKINRANMVCSVQDIIDGKIPDEYLKGRGFFYHFLFIHKITKNHLYPSKIDLYVKKKGGSLIFYEPYMYKSTNKVVLKKSESFDFRTLKSRLVRALDFNIANNNGHLMQPLFTTIDEKRPKVYDDYKNILVYFIHKNDYNNHRDFLNRIIGKN